MPIDYQIRRAIETSTQFRQLGDEYKEVEMTTGMTLWFTEPTHEEAQPTDLYMYFDGEPMDKEKYEEHLHYGKPVRHRDTQREKLYRAERIFCKRDLGKYFYDPDFVELSEVCDYITHVVERDWFKKTYGRLFGYHDNGAGKNLVESRILVETGARHKSAKGGRDSMVFPAWSRSKLIILHELSHVIEHRLNGMPRMDTPYGLRYVRFAPHGRLFAHIYLSLVGNMLGQIPMENLRRQFRKDKVAYNKRFFMPAKQRQILAERLAATRPNQSK